MAEPAAAEERRGPPPVGRVRVRGHGACSLPRSHCREKDAYHFYVTAHCDHSDAPRLSTPRLPADWGAPGGGALGCVDWAAGCTAAEAPPGPEGSAAATVVHGVEADVPFWEVTSDLLLRLHRWDPKRPDARAALLAELCLPLAALPAATAAAAAAAPGPLTPAHWHELLLPRPRDFGLHRPQALPDEGAPGRIKLAASVSLDDRKAAYLRAEYTPNPARNLFSRRGHEDAVHPGVNAAAGVTTDALQKTFVRTLASVLKLAAGWALAPLRTACYLQTWREPGLNAAVAAAAWAATTPFAWRFVLVLWPLYLWAWTKLNGVVARSLRALERPHAWCERPPAGGGVVGAVIHAPGFIWGFKGTVQSVVRMIQWWLVVIGERAEGVDNALSFVDPHLSELLFAALGDAATVCTIALLALHVLPTRQLARAAALPLLFPLPAHTFRAHMAVARALQAPLQGLPNVDIAEEFAVGLRYLPAVVAAQPAADMYWPDRALSLVLRWARGQPAARKAERAAAEAVERAAKEVERAATSRTGKLLGLFKRLPERARAEHMLLNARALTRLQARAPAAFIRCRLAVTYCPLLAHRGALALRVQLFADDVDAAEAALGGGGAARAALAPAAPGAEAARDIRLDFLLVLREGERPLLRLAPAGRAARQLPWLGTCDNADCHFRMPPLDAVATWQRAEPLLTLTLTLRPDWRASGGGLRAELDGVRTALQLFQLRPRRSSLGRLLPPASLLLGTVPLQLAARRSDGAQPTPLPAWLRPSQQRHDVVLSFRSCETGALAPDGRDFAAALRAALEACRTAEGAPVRVYACPEDELADAVESGTLHGVRACRLFVPICSATYADTRVSPATANELFCAWRAGARAAGGGGAPHILPVWHSGPFPPAGAAPVLRRVPPWRLPRAAPGEEGARDKTVHDLELDLLAARVLADDIVAVLALLPPADAGAAQLKAGVERVTQFLRQPHE
jgi:hypothetical protein